MYILGFDPGETTGYCLVIYNTVEEVGDNPLDSRVKINAHGEFKDFDGLDEVIWYYGVDTSIIVCEDYIIYPNRTASHSLDRVNPARMIGTLEYIAHTNDSEFVLQPASQAKQRWPNSRLNSYFPQSVKWSNHERDALRHVLTFIEVHCE